MLPFSSILWLGIENYNKMVNGINGFSDLFNSEFNKFTKKYMGLTICSTSGLAICSTSGFAKPINSKHSIFPF